MSFIRALFLASISLGIAFTTHAVDIQSPRSASLGGAGRGGPFLNDAIFLNPAYLSFQRNYGITFNWLSYTGDPGTDRGRNYTISAQDGMSELFQAGAAFTQLENGRFLHLGASKALLDRLSVALSAKTFMPKDEKLSSAYQFTFATTAVPLEFLQASFVIDNLNENPVSRQYGLYREIIAGSKFNAMGVLALYVDAQVIPNYKTGALWGYSAGTEVGLGSGLFMRVGKFTNTFVPFNRQVGSGYGIGLGYLAPKLALDYGLQRITQFESGYPDQISHNFGATVFF